MSDENEGPPKGRRVLGLGLGALGVVYGDIGTSPLYALRQCFLGRQGVEPSPDNVLGVLSLITWSLIVVISVKYLAYVMRAENAGEGGVLALMALAHDDKKPGRRQWLVVVVGLFGAALLYGDGMITPAISVLSAVEGLEVPAPELGPYVIPIAVAILVALFMLQHRGTGKVGGLFGPLMLLWFAAIAVTGALQLLQRPEAVAALWPGHAVRFFAEHGLAGIGVLGSVFLVVTGGEALYADMGHFGAKPIRISWYAVVLPALLLSYFGQGALLLARPDAVSSPFFHMVPDWAIYPMIGLATLATIIASQAVISGAFSLSRQAVMLGYLPRLQIRHTSARQIGQVYLPGINWALMVATVLLVVGFGSSSALAGAYGVAVSTTMVITSALACIVAVRWWHWPLPAALAVTAVFLVVDLSFFGANLLKIIDGGWVPLTVAGAVLTVMTTWSRGREILRGRTRERATSWDGLSPMLEDVQPRDVPGTVVYLSGLEEGLPVALALNIRHNRVLHEQVVLLTVVMVRAPHVPVAERLEVHQLDERFVRIIGRYGFLERPNVPNLLRLAEEAGLHIVPSEVTFIVGRHTLLATKRPGMALWRERLFGVLSRNAQDATAFLQLPPDRVLEIGSELEL